MYKLSIIIRTQLYLHLLSDIILILLANTFSKTQLLSNKKTESKTAVVKCLQIQLRHFAC